MLEKEQLRQAIEAKEAKKRFRAKPIPASMYLPIYQELENKLIQRKKFIKVPVHVFIWETIKKQISSQTTEKTGR